MGRHTYSMVEGKKMSIGYLFPGQGAQSVGMGKDLYDQFPAAKQIFEQADSILGYPISKICFEGPEETLTKTHHAQPAIFVMSLAALAVIEQNYPDLKPSYTSGLSLGEFTALVAAKAISFENGLKLVQKRAEAMERAAQKNPGTMASIMGLDQQACEKIAKEAGCQVANLNTPDQIVLSGSVESIDKACTLSEQAGAKRAIKLKVGGAFHSALMKDAENDLRNALSNTPIQIPVCIFVSNVSANKVESPDQIRDFLARQLTSPVRWAESMAGTSEFGIVSLLEIGPGSVLKGLARKSNKNLSVESIGSAADIPKIQQLFQKAS